MGDMGGRYRSDSLRLEPSSERNAGEEYSRMVEAADRVLAEDVRSLDQGFDSELELVHGILRPRREMRDTDGRRV